MALAATQEQDFVSRLRPVLETLNTDHLVEYLREHVAPGELLSVLAGDDRDATNVALVCLAALGTMEHSGAIARQLLSDDPMTVRLAEHALWSIWFRDGDERANSDLRCIVSMIEQGRLDDAGVALDELARRCPGFAEVYNQRSMVSFLQGDYDSAVVDSRRTLTLNPYHFAAMANLANALALSGQLGQALRVYGRVSRLYPTMEGLRESIRHIRDCVEKRHDAEFSPPG